MNEWVKKLWVSALRSGQYQQGRDRLRTVEVRKIGEGATITEAKDCCLGVLCDLFRIEKPGEGRWADDGAFLVLDSSEDDVLEDEETMLPEAVQEWAGLDDGNPALADGVRAASYNDGEDTGDGRIERRTFAQIADMIEEVL